MNLVPGRPGSSLGVTRSISGGWVDIMAVR